MENVTLIEMAIYERLHASLKKASQIEEVIKEGSANFNYLTGNAIRKLEHLAANDLPEYMGRLISELGLLQQFQSLGRHIRSYTDAEYVLRNLREQILSRLGNSEPAYAAIRGLIACTDIVIGQSDIPAKA